VFYIVAGGYRTFLQARNEKSGRKSTRALEGKGGRDHRRKHTVPWCAKKYLFGCRKARALDLLLIWGRFTTGGEKLPRKYVPTTNLFRARERTNCPSVSLRTTLALGVRFIQYMGIRLFRFNFATEWICLSCPPAHVLIRKFLTETLLDPYPTYRRIQSNLHN
jgi:hypothetical protein